MRRLALDEGMQWSAMRAVGIVGTRDVLMSTQVVRPGPGFASIVERFSVTTWGVRPTGRALAVILPLPETSLLVSGGSVRVAGVHRGRITLSPTAPGRVFAITLRPSAVPHLLGRRAAEFADRLTPPGALTGALDIRILAAQSRGIETLVDLVAAFGAAVPPTGSPARRRRNEDLVDGIVRDIREDTGLTRVADICERFHVSPRTLQRLFHVYLGVTPKWLLRHYRVHSAARRLQAEVPGRRTEIAAFLGYFDESHFARDFGDVVGVTPTTFARAARTKPDLRVSRVA